MRWHDCSNESDLPISYRFVIANFLGLSMKHSIVGIMPPVEEPGPAFKMRRWSTKRKVWVDKAFDELNCCKYCGKTISSTANIKKVRVRE